MSQSDISGVGATEDARTRVQDQGVAAAPLRGPLGGTVDWGSASASAALRVCPDASPTKQLRTSPADGSGVNPNFFLLGPPKAGTTAVAAALGRHPQVFMSDPKEPNHFLYAGGNPHILPLDRNVPDRDDYLALFAGAKDALIRGEASPYYICVDHCAQEIARFAPDAKLMVILRNPVERAFSAYRYWHDGDPDFRADPVVFRELFLNRSLVSPASHGGSNGPFLEWLQDHGRYADMLERYDAHFAPEQILLLRYDYLATDPAGFMSDTLGFLGVDPAAAPRIRKDNVTVEPMSRKLNYWLNFDVENSFRQAVKTRAPSKLLIAVRELVNRINRRSPPALPAHIYNELIEVYADDLSRLAKRTKLDFSDWLRPRTA